ncbi:MAG TPA: hypothetical protein VGK24_21710 [Candidatus Angelobacter sp.]|jgi:hypothetical protein
MPIPKELHSRNLVPFKKRRGAYRIPGLTRENEPPIGQVEQDLTPEEQRFVRHYLSYADQFLRSVPEEEYTRPAEEINETIQPEKTEKRPQVESDIGQEEYRASPKKNEDDAAEKSPFLGQSIPDVPITEQSDPSGEAA